MWPGTEPARGQFNQTYIEQIRTIVNTLGALGVYTIIDLHQDALSRYFCGEGVPNWAVQPSKDFPLPLPYSIAREPNNPDYPVLADCVKHSFVLYMFT